ncbi:hypothetical protein BPJM79_40283 [Bacillus pumilus]
MAQALFKQVEHKTYRFLDAIAAVKMASAFKSHISALEASHYDKYPNINKGA